MIPTKRITNLADRVTSEHVLLLSMLVVAVYMFAKSYAYSPAAAFFPRFTASITIVGVLLLLFRSYLPSRLQQYVSTSMSIIDQDVRTESIKSTVEAEREDGIEQAEVQTEPRQMRWGSKPGLVTVCLMGAYILGSYLVGMLWVTPVFVFAYLVWFEARWVYAVVLSALSFALAYMFMVLLLIDIDGGVLFDAGLML